jgi:hypothetical protein
MFAQTIALFKYLMLGILSRRLLLLTLVLAVLAMLVGGFFSELAIIDSNQIVVALVADFLRYALGLFALLVITTSVSQDYEFRQFERLLTMPLARWQYIAAQVLVIASLCLLLVLPVLLVISLYSDWLVGLYWASALWLEIFLLGLLGMLAIISLEKIPLAVCFSMAQMLEESVRLSDGSLTSRFVDLIFSAILYLLPGLDSFANNNVFFGNVDLLQSLSVQFYSTVIYALFLIAVCLVDFYRKEFSL